MKYVMFRNGIEALNKIKIIRTNNRYDKFDYIVGNRICHACNKLENDGYVYNHVILNDHTIYTELDSYYIPYSGAREEMSTNGYEKTKRIYDNLINLIFGSKEELIDLREYLNSVGYEERED